MPFRHALNACTLALMCLTASLAMSLAQAAQWMQDIQRVRQTELRAFYNRHYQPSNALLVK